MVDFQASPWLVFGVHFLETLLDLDFQHQTSRKNIRQNLGVTVTVRAVTSMVQL